MRRVSWGPPSVIVGVSSRRTLDDSRIKPVHTLGADAVTEIRIGAVTDVYLELIPIAPVVSDSLASLADGEEPT